VAGFRECAGGEHSFFDCPAAGNPTDPTGVAGVDPSCTHAIDQGAICEDDRVNGRMKAGIEVCGGAKMGLAASGQTPTNQPAVFGCVDYYTAQCHYSVTNAEVGGCATCASYTRALREFAQCVERTSSGMTGYCHGSLGTTAHLANQYVCNGGVNRNIGFHIRLPFLVNQAGEYTFRMHADYGLGSFIGVDGAEHTPGNVWGHLQLAPATLSVGDHEFESLGFEDCCDGHAELELHLPCDQVADVWRLVVSGPSDCLLCGQAGATVTAAPTYCSAQTDSAGFCGQAGTTRPVQVGDTTLSGSAPVGGTHSHCVHSGNTGNVGGTAGYGQGAEGTLAGCSMADHGCTQVGSDLAEGETVTFHLQVCVDHQDDIYFQDHRIWFQYGGQYSATGQHSDCPAAMLGKAAVDGVVHDISALSSCTSGTSCPPVQVAPANFAMPTGCQEMRTTAEKSPDATAVYNTDRPDLITNRGEVTIPVHPSASNAWRGEVEITDFDGGAVAYDIVVSITCMGTSSSDADVRLSCTAGAGTDRCHQGRIEVNNPAVGWGTVCGHNYCADQRRLLLSVCSA